MTDLEKQGFIKHDGGGCPEGMDPDDMVDVVGTTQLDNDFEWRGIHATEFVLWGYVTHYRLHISERKQLDMAIEAIWQLLDDMGGDGLSVCQAAKEQAQSTLTLLQQRKEPTP